MVTVQAALDQAWKAHQAGQVAVAEAVYRQVLSQAPRHAAAHVYLGIALFDQRRFDESIAAYRAALSIQNHFPIAWNNLGNSLRMVGDVAAADESFSQALQQQPGYLSPLKNRGTLWIWAGEIERGLEAYREALQIAPDDPELHRNLGVIYLLLGRYQEGWREYRYRWHFNPGGRPGEQIPPWRGESPAGKTFLLYPEQGIGDAIQFVRVGHTLRQAGAKTILRCDSKLVPLFSSVGGIDLLVPHGIPLNQFGVNHVDYHASLIDVVDYWYESRGELATAYPALPGDDAAYLSIQETLVDYWRRALTVPRPRVGICWQGNPQHHADIYRSVALAQFAPLAAVPGVSLLSLQHGFGKEQLDQVAFGDRVARLPDGIDQSSGAFLDTAAIIRNLDLVITVDTSTAHLAAALGVPVWLILGRVPDWRWRQTGDTSDWYPSIRIFRQPRIGAWPEVFESVAAELAQRYCPPPH